MAVEKSITEQISDILLEYSEDTKETIDKCFQTAAKRAKELVVSKSPDDTGGYKRGWAIKKKKSATVIETVVYNKTDYQLTHLLEHSHVIRNKNGTYGRTSPGHGQVVHIAPAEAEAERFLLEELKRNL